MFQSLKKRLSSTAQHGVSTVALKLSAGQIAQAKQSFMGLPQVSAGHLKAGDILIVKDFSPGGEDEDADGIRAGQALFSRMGTKGSCSSEHVILVASDAREDVIECVGSGAIRRSFISSREHVVYRYTGEAKHLLRKRAVEVAEWLSGNYSLEDRARLATGAPGAQVDYASMTKVSASLLRSKVRGLSSHRRIKQIANEFASNQPATKNGNAKYKMICSEFAATCYEVAAWDCHALSPLGVDPRAMTAKALEAMLNRGDFKRVGRYKGAVSHRMHLTLVGREFLGPLLVMGDRELALGNTIQRVGSTALTLPNTIPGAAPTQEHVWVAEFFRKFDRNTVSSMVPGVRHAKVGKCDYVYSRPTPWAGNNHTLMALRAPSQ